MVRVVPPPKFDNCCSGQFVIGNQHTDKKVLAESQTMLCRGSVLIFSSAVGGFFINQNISTDLVLIYINIIRKCPFALGCGCIPHHLERDSPRKWGILVFLIFFLNKYQTLNERCSLSNIQNITSSSNQIMFILSQH